MKNQRRVSETDYHNEQLYALANIQARYLHVRVSHFVLSSRTRHYVVTFVFVADEITSGSQEKKTKQV